MSRCTRMSSSGSTILHQKVANFFRRLCAEKMALRAVALRFREVARFEIALITGPESDKDFGAS
jgi:hypothetical protein